MLRTTRLFCIVSSLCLLLSLVAVWYVSQESQIYYWDYANYHRKLHHLVALLDSSGPISLSKSLLSDIRSSDYNPIPVLPLLPIALAFSTSRIVYITSGVILALVPVCLLAAATAQRAWSADTGLRTYTAFLLIPVICPFLWIPVLRGYPDLVALLLLAILTRIGQLSRNFTNLSTGSVAAVGGLVWLIFLCRRHFAYSLIIFLLAHALQALSSHRLSLVVRRFAIISLASSSLALLAQPILVGRILQTNYSSLYAAYDLGFAGNLHALFSITGFIWPLYCLFGVLYAIHLRRSQVLFYASIAVVSYLFFQLTQKPGPHHLLPSILWLLPAASWPSALFTRPDLKPLSRLGFSAITLPLLFFGWFASLSPRLCIPGNRGIVSSYRKYLCPIRRFPPLIYPQLSKTRLLFSDLSSSIRPGSKIVVAASSQILNAEIVSALFPSARQYLVHTTGDIDRRDGFKLAAFQEADILITTDIPQLHRAPQYQQVVVIPSSKRFRSHPTFLQVWRPIYSSQSRTLPSGIRLLVYQRKPDIGQRLSVEEAMLLLSEFRRVNPRASLENGSIRLP